MVAKKPQTVAVAQEEAERLARKAEELTRKLKAANEQVHHLEEKQRACLKHIARAEKVMVRLDAENTRLHQQLKDTARSDVGTLLAAYDAGDRRLRAIARMRSSLHRRPADWYLAHEAVAQAEAYREEVQHLHFSRQELSTFEANKDVDELLASSPA